MQLQNIHKKQNEKTGSDKWPSLDPNNELTRIKFKTSAFVASSCQFTDTDTLRIRRLIKMQTQCMYDHTRVGEKELNHICVFSTSISTYKYNIHNFFV